MKRVSATVALLVASAHAVNINNLGLSQTGAERRNGGGGGARFGDIFGALAATSGAIVGGDVGSQIGTIGVSVGDTSNGIQDGDAAASMAAITQGVGGSYGGDVGQ